MNESRRSTRASSRPTVPRRRTVVDAAARDRAARRRRRRPAPAGDALGPRVRGRRRRGASSTLLAEQRDEYLALAQRTQADFENYRKRVARDAATAELRGVGRLARELLPALDNLERALAAAVAGHRRAADRRACGWCQRELRGRARAGRHRVLRRRRRALRPRGPRGGRAAAARRRRAGRGHRGLPARLPARGRRDPAPRPRGRRGLGGERSWRTHGPLRRPRRRPQGVRRRDQEGLPQARAPVPP